MKPLLKITVKKKNLEGRQFLPTRVWEEGELSAKISCSDSVVIC